MKNLLTIVILGLCAVSRAGAAGIDLQFQDGSYGTRFSNYCGLSMNAVKDVHGKTVRVIGEYIGNPFYPSMPCNGAGQISDFRCKLDDDGKPVCGSYDIHPSPGYSKSCGLTFLSSTRFLMECLDFVQLDGEPDGNTDTRYPTREGEPVIYELR